MQHPETVNAYVNDIILAAGLLLAACHGELSELYGDILVVRADAQVEPWADLPEALADVQTSTRTPGAACWDGTTIYFIRPFSTPRGVAHEACLYEPDTHRVIARVTGDYTAKGCLPHELAHRWRHWQVGRINTVDDPDTEVDEVHDKSWAWRYRILADIMNGTWLAKEYRDGP